MSAASSEATEQLVASARATLVQVQNMLATQSDEGALARMLIDFYSWTVFIGLFSGWLAALLTHLLFGLWPFLLRETPILAGGIGVARVVVGAVFGVGFWF